MAHHYLGLLLTCLGRFDEANGPLRQAMRLQPTAANFQIAVGFRHLAAREFDWARAEFERAAELEPVNKTVHYWLGTVCEAEGDFLQAVSHFEKCGFLFAPAAFELIRTATLDQGARGYWRETLTAELGLNPPSFVRLARACAVAGDKQRALEFLERAAREEPWEVTVLRLHFVAAWPEMADELGFKRLLHRAGLAK